MLETIGSTGSEITTSAPAPEAFRGPGPFSRNLCHMFGRLAVAVASRPAS